MTPSDKKLERLYQRLSALRELGCITAIVEVHEKIRLHKEQINALS